MIRLAIAGMAHQHVLYVLDELAHQPQVQLVAVSEPDATLSHEYSHRTADVPVYQNHRDMLTDHEVDVVAVAGIYALRAGVIVDALHAGAHVISDKPLCTSLEQLSGIEEAVNQTGGLVALMFEKRGHPVTLAARRLISDGVIGDLTLAASTGPHKLRHDDRPPWFFTESYGGILGDLAVHDVDLILALTGATAGTVVGTTGTSAYSQHSGFSDHGAMLLVAGTVSATIDAHWLAPEADASNGRYQMRLVGTHGTALLRWSEGLLEVATHHREPWIEQLPHGRRPAEDFFTALLGDVPPEVGSAESLAATQIALLAQRSADRGSVAEQWTLSTR